MIERIQDYRNSQEAWSFRGALARVMLGRLGAQELEDGYRLTYSREGDWSARLSSLVDELQPQLPWLEFAVGESENGPELSVRGGELAKTWVTSEIQIAQSRSQLAAHEVSLRQRIRRATGLLRTRPDFLVIGTPRSGTTSVYSLLTRHPSVAQSPTKEVAYFNVLFEKGPTWYRSHFPTLTNRLRVRLRTGAFATGEATPSYLYHPHVPERVRQFVPDVKLIVLVRNPIDRAYSHYHLSLQTGYETLSFEEAVEREPARIEGELEKMLADEKYLSFPRGYLAYLTMGCYAEHLERWLKVFPREQLLIAPIEKVKSGEFAGEAIRFLGLPTASLSMSRPANQLQYPPMAEETRERLRDHFRPHNERLWELLGADYGWNDA
jgi:hypothetical protein